MRVEQQLTELIRELYAVPECGVGGPLHIVLDDGNIDDESIYFCMRTMRKHETVVQGMNGNAIIEICEEIADALLEFTQEKREELYEMNWGR
jgi:hypothetical protein